MTKPYYQDKWVTIYHGDCREILPQLDAEPALIIIDPPYNISKRDDVRDRSTLRSPMLRRDKPLNFDYGEWDNKDRESFLSFTKEWLVLCCEIVKVQGTIASFFSKEDISFLNWEAVKHGVKTRTIFVWHKTNPTPTFRKVNYLSACEFIWLGSKGSWTINWKDQKSMHNFFETPNSSIYGETEHPTEKPLILLKHLIGIHSNNGELILDPFLGSGTTAKACKQLNRQCIGIEIEEKYCEIAARRCSQEVMELM